jgi:signal transduction histidine kinase
MVRDGTGASISGEPIEIARAPTRRWPRFALKIAGIQILGGILAMLLGMGVHFVRTRDHLTEVFGQRLQAIAATAAMHLDGELGDLHSALVSDESLSSEAWSRWRDALRTIGEANSLSEDLYTFHPGDGNGSLTFAVRSYDRPARHTGLFIGEIYTPVNASQRMAIDRAARGGAPSHTGIFSDDLSDRRWISAYAPFHDSEGRVAGVLAVDADARQHLEALRSEMMAVLGIVVLISAATLLVAIALDLVVTRRLRLLAQATAALGDGNYGHPLPAGGHDEVDLLVDAFGEMRSRLRRLHEEVVSSTRLSTVGRMAASIIHDLKNPLTAIGGYAQLMTFPDISREERGRHNDEVQRNIAVMVEMTQDLLDYSRGAATLRLQATNPDTLVQEVVRISEHAMAEAHVTLCLESQCEEEVWVDASKVRRVLLNLVTNARQAMENSGGKMHLRSMVHSGRWVLEVQDTGPGIPEEVAANLFEPFVTHGKSNGTGLGLSIAKQFVEQHGGQISVTSERGRGTTFRIEVPTHQGDTLGRSEQPPSRDTQVAVFSEE